MSLLALDGAIWLLLSLLPFLLVQRWLHRNFQAVLLLLTRSPAASLGIFSFLFFPGVLLHELSHWLTAKLVGVRTGRFSLLPKVLPDGHLQLGFVETAPADIFRDALIGTAPLLMGGAAILNLGLGRLGLSPLVDLLGKGQLRAFLAGLAALPAQPDFWLWFYLAFVISSTMMPSASDRRAWLPLVVIFTALFGGALLAGAGPWLLANLAPGFNRGLWVLAAVFWISLGLHALLVLPVLLLRSLLTRLTGLRVVDRV